MNQIISMALKDIKLIARDKMGLFFIVGFPILMGLFFGLVMGSVGSSGGSNAMKVAIVDQDQSAMSRKFIESLQKNENLELAMTDRKDARESVRKGRRVGMVLLPKGFGERAGVMWGDPPDLEVGIDPSRNAETAMLQGFIMQGMGELAGQRFQDPSSLRPFIEQSRADIEASDASVAQRALLASFFKSIEGMIDSAGDLNAAEGSEGMASANEMQFANITSVDVSREVDPKSIAGQVQKVKSRWDISFPQAMLWGVLSCVTGFSISIARERTQGTFTRLQVAPIGTQSILAGKALACFLTSIAVVAFMTVFGIALGMQPHSLPKLVVAAICIAAAFTGIMMVVSVLGKTEQSVSGAGMAIIMVLAMLGGCMVPAMFMPGFLKTVGMISPVKWAIQAIEGAVWREFTWLEMMPPLLILMVFGMICFVIGNTVLKRQVS